MRALVLRLHRWLAIAFAVPLAVLIVTGLILSCEPAIHLAFRTAGTMQPEQIIAILKTHDPGGTVRAIAYRNYDGTLELLRSEGTAPLIVDVATNTVKEGLGPLARMLGVARRAHLTLLLNLRWLVTISTFAMLLLVALGLYFGLPRRPRTLSGWHKATAWIGLPLLIASPLTGVLIAFNVTMGGGAAAPPGMGVPSMMRAPANMAAQASPVGRPSPLPMLAAVQAASAKRNISHMVWIRTMGPRVMMRYMEEGQFQGYFVTPSELVPVPRNWPRSIHEGLWIGKAGPALNLVVSLLLIALLVTGLLLWQRRRVRSKVIQT